MSAPPPSHDLDDVAPIPVLPGPGEQLRSAREAVGMSVQEVATHMYLDSRIVKALEGDDYEELPAPTFVRGYLRGYARLLDIAPEPIIQAFEQRDIAPPSLVADLAVKSQIRSGDFPFRIVTYIVVAALIVLVVLWWRSQDFTTAPFDASPRSEPEVSEAESAMAAGEAAEALPPSIAPETPEPGETEAPAAEAEVGEAEVSRSEPTAPAERAATPEPDALASGDGTALPEGDAAVSGDDAGATASLEEERAAGTGDEASPASLPAAGAAPASAESEVVETGADADTAPETSAEEVAVETAPASPEEASPPPLEASEESVPDPGVPADLLAMRFVVECWLEVYDHGDERLFYGLAQAGDRLGLSGQGPFRLVLGNSEGVEVSYNGTPVDFSAFTAQGVARFSVGGEPPTAFKTPTAPAAAPAPGSGDETDTPPIGEPEPAGN